MRLSGAKYLFLFTAAAIVYFSCDDAGVITSPDYYITGKVTGWNLGHRRVDARIYGQSRIPYAVASATIDPQGNFSLKLPSSIADSELLPADSIFSPECVGGIAFAPPDSRGCILIDFQVIDGATATGILIRNNYDYLYAGAFSVFWIYTNRQVTFNGYKVCGTDSLLFGGTAAAGWNKVIRTCTRIDSTATYQYGIVEEPAGAVWKFQPY
jgi:hypothetical protein